MDDANFKPEAAPEPGAALSQEELDALTVSRPSLEDVYLRLTGAEELTHA